MIMSRTPFRISFFGGGTDYPGWYRENGGAILGTTIDKYCYVMLRYLPPFFDHKYRIRYSLREETQTIDEIKHPSVRECLRFMNPERGVEVQHNSDLPARSGIGSSSAFTVGLLNALYALKGKMVTKRQLTMDAIRIEQEQIQENVGSQDQTLAAFGGFAKITFGGAQEVTVQPMIVDADRLRRLEEHFMLFFTGFSRNASDIAGEQIRTLRNKTKELKMMAQLTEEAVDILSSNSSSFERFGELLDENWKIKRSLTTKITTPFVDELYETARRCGATGGKLLGAGGGGFILFFVKPELQPKLKETLKNLILVPFSFENLGSQIIYYKPDNNY